ncbi:cytoplasmic tRNA 2-thiolation protein 2 isoform X1 [Osmerus eperlanus]|uniref:cytoplasmic tRNA 2-thiolation protein 2 isoform X1 n=1 Tax=Osmerus eperlanus TaxID=29151 RepID=UPI002E0FB7FC
MCQVDDKEFNGQLEHREAPCLSKKCMKCKHSTAVLLIRAGDAFCRDCFKEYFVHKFRAMLGKNRTIFPGEKVLLAISGGPSSFSMLAQVQEGLSREASKKLRFSPGIVYIDEGGATGQSLEERASFVSPLEAVFKATGYPYYIVPLEQVLSLPMSVLEVGTPATDRAGGSYKAGVDQYIQNQHQSPGPAHPQVDLSHLNLKDGKIRDPALATPDSAQSQALQRLFASIKTLTAREDMLQTLRHHLILYVARSEGFSKVMLGDSCTRLAVRLLSSISLGRGSALAMDTGFSDTRYGDVVLVRPMRDYSSKEIAFYNRMFGVPTVFIPALDTKVPDKASIQRLTESFVTKLQADFPATVSTIYRTGEKLHTACPHQTSCVDHTAKCLLCMCALDTTVEEASAFQATLISEQLSQRKDPGLTPSPPAPVSGSSPVSPGQCCSSAGSQREGCGSGEVCCSSSRLPDVDVKSLLCYSCRLTVKDMMSVDTLPQYILSEAERRKRRSKMKEEISEFLLEKNEEDLS